MHVQAGKSMVSLWMCAGRVRYGETVDVCASRVR